MATVLPFTAVSYDTGRFDLGDVTCPPYDVISDADRADLYRRSPFNAVRITSGEVHPDDGPRNNRYTRAAAFFDDWLVSGVLRAEPEPAMCVYRQSFADPRGRDRDVWGMLATISLDDPILAHERTMAGPKEDRLALLEALPVNTSPIYALYREDGGAVSKSLPELAADAPGTGFTDDEGIRHSVWMIHDPSVHQRVTDSLASSPLLIADGHHRFETAKTYRDRRRAADGKGGWDATLALVVDAGAQPVCVLPYHRIVATLAADPLPVLTEVFDVSDAGQAAGTLDAIERELWDEGSFFYIAPGGTSLRLRPREAIDGEIPAGVLKRLALDPLGAGDAEKHLTFTPRAADVLSAVRAGAAAGFLIPAVSADDVWALAVKAGKMPEKSTYFHPKPRDGIVMRALEPIE